MFAVRYTIKLEKGEATGDVARRIWRALDAADSADSPVMIDLHDADATPVDRIVRAYPELQPFRFENALSNGGPPSLAYRHGRGDEPLPATPASGLAVSRETLQAVLDGVPRRFAVSSVCVVVGPVRALDLVGGSGLADGANLSRPRTVLGPVIAMNSSWGSPRRDVALYVTVLSPTPPRPKRPLLLPGAAQALLDAAGKVASTLVTAVVDAAEQERRQALQQAGDALIAQFASSFESSRLPHALQRFEQYEPQTGSLAEPVLAALRPLGYKSESGVRAHGLSLYARRTKGEHLLWVETDRTPIGAEFRVSLQLHVPGVALRWTAPVSSDPGALEVHDQAHCDRAAENLAVLVRRWEAELVPALLELVGPGADWYRPY
jgi:hypothetical protein